MYTRAGVKKKSTRLGTPSSPSSEVGFSLIEAIVATVIATIAVLALAQSFGAGRSLVDRYKISRAALATAEATMETLVHAGTKSSSLMITTPGGTTYGPLPFDVDGVQAGDVTWTVSWVDDPADGLAPTDTNPQDLKRVSVGVAFSSGGVPDTVRLVRFFSAS